MNRGNYSQGKRRREAEKSRKKKDKAARRVLKRERGSTNEDQIGTVEEVVGNLPTIDQAMQAIEDRAAAPRRSATTPCRLFVGSLSWDTTDNSLRDAFASFGAVAEAVVVKDRSTGNSRGFGFVTMADRKDAVRAIEALNDFELDGRRIAVNIATA